MHPSSGKVTLFTIAIGLVLFAAAITIEPFTFSPYAPQPSFAQQTATTTVTVLNTPPQWTTDAQEQFESSTSTPTNVGSAVSWIGTGTDDNGESYYLLLCKSSSTPTANPSAPPTCGGGAGNQWAVSSYTTSGIQAVASYTTLVGDAEQNDWFAWICDANGGFPQCNTTYKQGTGTSSSPFYVNHRPNFTAAADNSPANPGAVVTWTTNASDTDVVGGNDQVRLWVCHANDFTGSACGAAGTYCSSTLAATNPTCSSTLSTVFPDQATTSFAYVLDEHGLAASGGAEATNTILTINNVAPTLSSSTVYLEDPASATSSLYLTVAAGQTTGFKVKFTVTDYNSCQTAAGGNEISVTSSFFSVYRSGIGQSNCISSSTNYNPNNCYLSTLPTSTFNYSCVQDGGSCSGQSDPDATFTCTFPIWFLADPTDGVNATDSVYYNQDWRASARATDNNGATSSLTEVSTPKEMISYVAYELNTSDIAYGSLQPGSSTDPIVATTTVSATGNVGLDETLYGLDMCTTFPACAPGSTTSTIAVANQKYATSSVGYTSSSAVALLVNPGAELEVNILKTTQTSTYANGATFWGIKVPNTITLSGDYSGQNTFIGKKGEAQYW